MMKLNTVSEMVSAHGILPWSLAGREGNDVCAQWGSSDACAWWGSHLSHWNAERAMVLVHSGNPASLTSV